MVILLYYKILKKNLDNIMEEGDHLITKPVKNDPPPSKIRDLIGKVWSVILNVILFPYYLFMFIIFWLARER